MQEKYPQSEINKTKSKVIVDECYICEEQFKKGNRVHKSHTIPQRNLSLLRYKNDGNLLTPRIITKFSSDAFANLVKNNTGEEYTSVKTETGVSNCMYFRLICSDCDNKKFENYENSTFVDAELTTDLKNSLALKSYLYSYYYSMDKQTIQAAKPVNYNSFHNSKLAVDKMIAKAVEDDVTFYLSKLTEILEAKEKGCDKYDVIFDRTIEHRVPMAAQINVPVLKDISGKKIIQDHKGDYVEEIIIIILPDKTKSRIIVLSDKENSKLFEWLNDFNNLSITKQHKEMLFLLLFQKDFGYYFSKSVEKVLVTNESIGTIMFMSETLPHLDFSVSKNNMPDLLARKHALYK